MNNEIKMFYANHYLTEYLNKSNINYKNIESYLKKGNLYYVLETNKTKKEKLMENGWKCMFGGNKEKYWLLKR